MYQRVTQPNFEELMSYINRYEGFFTSQHARLAGYSVQNQSYHVKRGEWERHGRGIFRYKYYPHIGQRQDLIVATLWTCNRSGQPTGVVSHDSALAVHKLSTWSGHGIHMSVPEGFRRRSSCIYRVRLHRRHLNECDVEDLESFKVTTPVRTIADLLLSKHIENIHVLDAMKDAVRRKLITKGDIKRACLNPDAQALVVELFDKVNSTKAHEV